MWAVVIIIIVLLIPLTAIVLDSQLGQALAARISGGERGAVAPELESRLERLEADVRYLSESVESLQEETRFIRALMEAPPESDAPRIDAGD